MLFLSIIIPAYNEEKRLPQTLEKVNRYLRSKDYSYQIIIVDDGSTDRTKEVIQKLISSWSHFRIIGYKQNQGKGYAVKTGMLVANGAWRLFMDADNSTDIKELDKLIKFVSDYQVIIGSRYLNKESIKIKQKLSRRLFSRFGNIALQNIFRLNLRDTQCGFKLYSGVAAEKIFSRLTTSRWIFDVETLVIASHLGYKTKEVPIVWSDARISKMQNIPALESLTQALKIKSNLKKGLYD